MTSAALDAPLRIEESLDRRSDRDAYEVLRQLRPHLDRAAFEDGLAAIRADGGRLLIARREDACVGCAVFRAQYRFSIGRLVYVDDLVTDVQARSLGIGASLLRWIEEEAKRLGAAHLVLDSGVQRADAHRFYFREGFAITSFNLKKATA